MRNGTMTPEEVSTFVLTHDACEVCSKVHVLRVNRILTCVIFNCNCEKPKTTPCPHLVCRSHIADLGTGKITFHGKQGKSE
jgi:hypothetical protein